MDHGAGQSLVVRRESSSINSVQQVLINIGDNGHESSGQAVELRESTGNTAPQSVKRDLKRAFNTYMYFR